MTESRWWTIAVIATWIILSVLVFIEHDSVARTVGAIATTAAVVAVWLVFGRRALVDRVGQHWLRLRLDGTAAKLRQGLP